LFNTWVLNSKKSIYLLTYLLIEESRPEQEQLEEGDDDDADDDDDDDDERYSCNLTQMFSICTKFSLFVDFSKVKVKTAVLKDLPLVIGRPLLKMFTKFVNPTAVILS